MSRIDNDNTNWGDNTKWAAEWAAQPYFVINDEGYDRMLHHLQNGRRAAWSYQTTCPHVDRPGRDCYSFSFEEAGKLCDCPKMMNVLVNGRIVRIVNGEQKSVFRTSEYIAAMAEGDSSDDAKTDEAKP